MAEISVMLKEYDFVEDEYIYEEGERARHINFITKGTLGFVI